MNLLGVSMATKNQLTIARLKKSGASYRKKYTESMAIAKAYSPSVTKTVTVGAGGYIAGCVQTGQYLPSSIAGISTPLIVGGLLASYGIFSKEQSMLSSLAVNLGNGMIASWSAELAKDMHGGQQQSDTIAI